MRRDPSTSNSETGRRPLFSLNPLGRHRHFRTRGQPLGEILAEGESEGVVEQTKSPSDAATQRDVLLLGWRTLGVRHADRSSSLGSVGGTLPPTSAGRLRFTE